MSKGISHTHCRFPDWSGEGFEKKKKRARMIMRCLRIRYPAQSSMLRYKTSMQMLVATMLSAQATDKKVNEVTQEKGLFRKYKTVNDFAQAHLQTLEKEIKSLGFYRQKAKNIIASARMIRDAYGGKMPRTLDEMTRLAGVARKTANIVLNHIYGIAEGISVDTHVRQVSRRFGFSKENDPVKIEKDLMRIFPKKDWIWISYTMVEYNRSAHASPRPECEWCYLRSLCPKIFHYIDA